MALQERRSNTGDRSPQPVAVPDQLARGGGPGRFLPIVAWAAAGAVLLAFEVYVLVRWIGGSNFESTDPGADDISDGKQAFFIALQVVVPVAAAVAIWFWVIRPWRREGRLTTDAMFVLAGAMLFFWDMSLNYTTTALLYNSHFVNFGAWANGSWPSWVSPNGDRLPEPILVCQPGYTSLAFSQVMLILWVLRKIKARRRALGPITAVGIMFVGLIVIDTVVESILLLIGIYAYPHGIRSFSLFSGETYQLPMTEPIFFAGFGLGSIAALMYFRDDKGETVVERGASALRVVGAKLQWIKFLAIFGAVHAAFALLYFVPNQWIATHGDEFPDGYKSYMINEMCNYQGADPDLPACPGPGVPIPRP